MTSGAAMCTPGILSRPPYGVREGIMVLAEYLGAHVVAEAARRLGQTKQIVDDHRPAARLLGDPRSEPPFTQRKLPLVSGHSLQ